MIMRLESIGENFSYRQLYTKLFSLLLNKRITNPISSSYLLIGKPIYQNKLLYAMLRYRFVLSFIVTFFLFYFFHHTK